MHRNTRATAFLLALLPTAAMAQTAAPSALSPERAAAREKVRAACSADVQKFCATIERGKGAMRVCLDAHQSELSPACREAREERAALRAKEKG
jgi:hypothetical protein